MNSNEPLKLNKDWLVLVKDDSPDTVFLESVDQDLNITTSFTVEELQHLTKIVKGKDYVS